MSSLSAPLVRIMSIAVLAHLVFVSARMTGALYALAHKASAFTVGVLMALFALVPMLIAVRAGRWIDRAGARLPVASGLALILAGAALPAVFSYELADIAPLLVGATLMGTGQMLVLISIQQLVGERAPAAQRTTVFSWLALGVSLSGMVGPVVSGALIDHLGHRSVYVGMLLTVCTAAALLWVNRALLPHRPVVAEINEPAHPFELLRHAPLRDVLLATVLVSMSWDLQTFMVPVHGTAVGLSASGVGAVLGAFASATFVVRAAMPWLSRHFQEWQILCATLVTAALAFALFPLFHTLPGLVAVAFGLGLGLGAAQPNVMSLLHARAPLGRVAEALGLRTTLMNTSHVALPLLYGASASLLGVPAMFWAMAVLLGLGSLMTWRTLRPS